ncbi:MAG: TRAP transporter small permease [Burkholderiales bacterium]|jgi:TRAP-type C4-dicarboxylate transport system permease small subunit
MSSPHQAPPSLTAEQLAQEFEEAHEPADLKVYALEDWFTFAIFWLLCGVVFLQFFTRYVLNDSAAWTEEVARYLLIGVVFLGAAMCTRLDRHIHVDLIYRYLPKAASRALVTAVDVFRTGFLAYCVWLAYQVTVRVGHQPMTMMDWPLGIVFGFVGVSFAFMAVRAALLTLQHLRTGTSELENPGHLSSEG